MAVDYYPVAVNLMDKDVLVVGGGNVAERKVKRLLTYGARVTVVSPDLTPFLTEAFLRGQIEYRKKRYRESDLRNARMVFAATDNRSINKKIAENTKQKGVWANIADPGYESTFILPSVIRRKNFTVSISTNGTSPRHAKRLREILERLI